MLYKNINDYEIFNRIRENDEFALDEMFKKYEPIIISIAKKYYSTAKRYGMEMDDLVQEGRIAMSRAIDTYNESSDSLFYTYVVVCVERRLISFCRNISRTKRLALANSVNDECLYYIGDVSFEPSLYVMERFSEEQFINYKNKFQIIDSSIFELRYNGFTYKEISELLDVSIGFVDSHLCKIRKILQVEINEF